MNLKIFQYAKSNPRLMPHNLYYRYSKRQSTTDLSHFYIKFTEDFGKLQWLRHKKTTRLQINKSCTAIT